MTSIEESLRSAARDGREALAEDTKLCRRTKMPMAEGVRGVILPKMLVGVCSVQTFVQSDDRSSLIDVLQEKYPGLDRIAQAEIIKRDMGRVEAAATEN